MTLQVDSAAVTGMVDVTAARLLDVVPGRSGTVLSQWIAARHDRKVFGCGDPAVMAGCGRTRAWPSGGPVWSSGSQWRRSGRGLLSAGFVPGAGSTAGDVAEAAELGPDAGVGGPGPLRPESSSMSYLARYFSQPPPGGYGTSGSPPGSKTTS